MNPRRSALRAIWPAGLWRLLGLLALLAGALPALAGLSNTSEWPMMGGTAGHTGELKGNIPPAGTTMGIEWARQLGSPVLATPAISDDDKYLVVGTADGRIVWLDIQTNGNVNYTVQIPTKTPFLNTPLVDKNNNNIYAGNANGRLYAVRRGTAAPIWTAPAVGQKPWGPLAAAPIFIGDDIIVASMDGCIYKVASADGSWSRMYGPIGAGIESTPVLGVSKGATVNSALAVNLNAGATSVQVANASVFDPGDELKIGANPAMAVPVGYITRVDTVTNTLYFTLKTVANYVAGADSAYATHHQPLYFAGTNGRVYAINADESPSHLRWMYPDPPGKAQTFLSASVMFTSLHVYIGDVGGNLYCIDGYSGKLTEMMSAATLNIGHNLTSAAGKDVNKQIFVGGDTGLVAIDVTNPAAMVVQRKYTVFTTAVLAQPVVGTASKVMVSTGAGLYAVNHDADTEMWHWFPTRQFTLTGSPLLHVQGPNRRVLLVSREGDVLCLLKDQVVALPALGKVSLGRWPQYQVNAAHPGALGATDPGFTAPLDGMTTGEYTARKLRWVAPTGGAVRSSTAVIRMGEHERTAVLQADIAAPPAGAAAGTTLTVLDAGQLHVGDPVTIGNDYLGPIAAITRTPAAGPHTIIVTSGPRAGHLAGELVRVSPYRQDTVSGGDTHGYGSPTVGVSKDAAQGTLWYDNSPIYSPRSLTFSLRGLLQPRFTKNDGTALTTFAVAPGGQEVRFGFFENDAAVLNPTTQTDYANPTYLYVFLTDTGHIGIRRKVSAGGDPQEIDVAIPGAATYTLANGVEVVLAIRPTDVNKAVATAYYRLADSKGKFPDDFTGFTAIGSYNLPSGLVVPDPDPINPPPAYTDNQLPAAGTGLYPFLRGFDSDALKPGFDVTSDGTKVYISYDPVADVNVVGPGSSYVKVENPERFLPGDAVEIFHPTDPALYETFTVGGVTNSYIGLRTALKNSYPVGSLLRVGRPGAWAAYVGSDDGYLRALDPETGTAIWRTTASSYLGAVRSAPVIDAAHDRVYVTSAGGRLFAFAQNGQWLWCYPTVLGPALGPISTPPVLDEDGNVYFATDSGYIYKVTPDGELATSSIDPAKYATFPVSPDPALSPIAGGLALYRAAATANPTDLRVVFATRNGKVYLLDGNLAKKYIYPDDMANPDPVVGALTASPVVTSDGTIVIGDANGKVHAFYEDIASLKSRWQNTAADTTPIQYTTEGAVIAAAATANGVIYVADGPVAGDPTKGNHIYAITGRYTADFTPTVKTKQLDGAPAGPLTLDGVGNLLVSTEAGSVYCFAPVAGNDDPLWKWNAKTNGNLPLALPLRTAPALWLGNLVIAGSDDGNVYGIGPRGEVDPATPGLSIATPGGPWPLAYRSPRRDNSVAERMPREPGPMQPSLRWFSDLVDRLAGAPVVTDRTPDQSVRVYQGTNGGTLGAFNASTGEAYWKAKLAGEGQVRGAVAVHLDGTIAVGALDGRAYLYNPDGTVKWDTLTANATLYGGFAVAPIRTANGNVIVATADRLDVTGVYATVGGNPNAAAALLTALTDGNDATQVTSGGNLELTYDLGRVATVTRVRIRTADGGDLYFYRDGAWALFGTFGETTAARYLTVEANRGAERVKWVNRSATGAVQAFEVYTNDGPQLTAVNVLVDGVAGVLPSAGALTELTPNAAAALFVQRVRFTTMAKGELHAIATDGADITIGKYLAAGAAAPRDVTVNRMVTKVFWKRDPADVSTLDALELYGAGGGRVLLLNAATGVLLNEYPVAPQPPLGPVVAAMATSGNTLYLATADGQAVALSLANLAEAWRKPLTEQVLAPVTISETDTGNNEIVVITQDGTVRTLDTAGNAILPTPWTIPGPMSNAPALTTPMSGAARWAYLINDRGQMYRINLNSASAPVALGELPTAVKSSPVLDSTGLLYVGSENGALFCLDTNNLFVKRVVQGVPEWAIGQKWSYFPDRASLITALYEDAAPGATALRVNTVDGFMVGDAVQISRPDGSLPQSLGRVTNIAEPTRRTAYAGISGTAMNAANSATLDFSDATAIWPANVVVGAVCYQLDSPDVKYYVKAVDTPGKTITLLTPVGPAHTTAPVEWVFTVAQTANAWTLQLRTVDLDGDTFSEIGVGDEVTMLPWIDPATGVIPPLRRLGTVAKVDLKTNVITLDKPITLLGVYGEATNAAASKVLTLRITGKATNAANGTVLSFLPLPAGVAVGQTCYLVDDPNTVYTVQAVNVVNHTVTLNNPVPTGFLTEPATWAFNAPPPGLAAGQKCYIAEEPDTVYTIETVGPGVTVTLTAPLPVEHITPVTWTFETATALIPGGSQVFIGPVYSILYVSQPVSDWRTAGDIIRAVRGSAAPMRSAPSIGPGQIAYVGADDGLLYAIGPVGPAGFPPQLPQLPERTDVSPWFTFHRDNQRTGFADRQGPLTNDLRWWYDTTSTLESSPALGYPDELNPLGVLYVGTADELDGQGIPRQRGALISLNASSGRMRWRFSDNQAMGKVLSSPAVFVINREKPDGEIFKDERVVFGTVDAPEFFYSILTDALRLDDQGFEEYVSTRPVAGQRILVGDNIVGLYVTQPERFQVGMDVYITNAGTGSNFETFGTISSINGGLLRLSKSYVALRAHDLLSEVHAQKSEQGHLYCVDRTGELRWKYPPDNAKPSERIAPVQSSPVVDSAGSSYFGTLDGAVYAVNSDGELLWQFVVPRTGDAEADMEIISSPTLNRLGTRLFIGVSVPGSNRGYVIALDPLTADDANRMLWKRQLYVDVNGNGAYDANEPGPVTASPLISTIDGKEVLYIGTDDIDATDGLAGTLFALDPDTGNNAKTAAGVDIVPAITGPIKSTAGCVPESMTTVYTVTKVDNAGNWVEMTVAAAQTVPSKGIRVKIRGVNETLNRVLTNVAQQSEDPVTKDRVYRVTLDVAIDGAKTYATLRTQEQAIVVGSIDDPATAVKGDGKLYGFTEELAPLWNFPTMAPVRASPAISTETGVIGDRERSYTAYVGSNDFTLYAVTFYGTTKVLRWSDDMRDRVYASPVVGMRTSDQSWARALVFQASRDHILYAYGDQVGLAEEDIPPTPKPPVKPIIDDANPPPGGDVPSTVLIQKSVEYKDGDPSWWKFVVTVRNIGRGKVDNLMLYDNLPAELSYPLVDTPDLVGDPLAIPTTGPLNPDEMMAAPVNHGTPDKPQWEVVWTKNDGTGFLLKPDLGDPNQPTTEYKRTFVFYARVRPSTRTYASLGTAMKVTANGTVMNNDVELKTDAPAKAHLGDSVYVQVVKHPVPAEQGGNIGQNQIVARGKTYAGATAEELLVHKETPVANDWTDTFIVRFYYNGFVGLDKRLAPDGPELRTFSPWNYVDHESGTPLSYLLPYNFKTNGIAVGNRRMKTYVSAKATGAATSGIQIPLYPNPLTTFTPGANVPAMLANPFTTLPGQPLQPRFTPYAWRVTIQQGRTQLNQKIGEWGPETAFLERIEVGRISGGVPPGANSVRLKTTNLAKGLRVQAMKFRHLLFDNPTKPDVEVYVVNITENPPTPPDVKDLTFTFARPLAAGEEIEDGAVLRDEWTGDLNVLNPIAVSGLQGGDIRVGTEAVPGGTAAESTLTVRNASLWDAPGGPYASSYRIRVAPMDLRMPGNAIKWNDGLDDPALNTGVAFGDVPKGGRIWDGFRYDPYKEYHVQMSSGMLDLPDGTGLRSSESLTLHVTRRMPMHQPNGNYGTFEENKLTLLNDGARIFLDTNLDGVYTAGEDLRLDDVNANNAWDTGEALFLDANGNGLPGRGEPTFALGAFDVRIFMDVNGNGICDPGEPYYATAAAGDQFTTPDALPASPLRTTLGVAIQPALQVPNTILDLGRQPAGALYGLPLQLPTIDNTGNQPLTNVTARTSTTLATTDDYTLDLANLLLSTGIAGVKPMVIPGPPLVVMKVSLRHLEELQPLPFAYDLPIDWVVPKGAADDPRAFGRPFELPMTAGYRQPTGTYVGDVQISGAGGQASLTLSARVGEQRLSQVVPGLSSPPPFDFSYNLAQAPPLFNTGWTNYLTGYERSPVAVVLPKLTPRLTTVVNPKPLNAADPDYDYVIQVADASGITVGSLIRVGAQPRRVVALDVAQGYVKFTGVITSAVNDPVYLDAARDDLGVWVTSNTPLPMGPEPDKTKLLPAQDTDATLWYRRVKHLITSLNGVDTLTNRIAIPRDVASLTRALPDATADLVILRKKPTVDDPNPTVVWFGQAVGRPAPGVLELRPAITWAVPLDQTEVEILAHPWVPVFTAADVAGIRSLLVDPGNPAWSPKPIECITPSVTMDAAGDPWLAWSVSAIRRVTRYGQTNFLPGSYLAYRKFDPANPTSGGVAWITPPDLALQGAGLPKVTVREKASLWPLSWPEAMNGLAFYEGSGLGEARQLMYAFGFIQNDMALTVVTDPKPLPFGDPKFDLTIKVADDSALAVGMVVRVGAQYRRIAALDGANDLVEFTTPINTVLNDGVYATAISATVTAAGTGAEIQLDAIGDIVRGMSLVIDNPTLTDAVVTVIEILPGNKIRVNTAVRVEANALVRKYWTLDVPLTGINRAFTSTGAVQAFADSKNGAAEAGPRYLNLVFQGTANANTDLYYARVKVEPKPPTDPQASRPLVIQPLDLNDKPVTYIVTGSMGATLEVSSTDDLTVGMALTVDNPDPSPDGAGVITAIVDATHVTLNAAITALSDAPVYAQGGVVKETLRPTDPAKPVLFTGGRNRAWWLHVKSDPQQVKLTVQVKDGTTDTVTMDAWNDKPVAWPAAGELVDIFGARDPVREYQLEYTGANGKAYRLGFDPYVGTVRVLRQPAAPAKVGDPDYRIAAVAVTGVPRVQRLTSHYAPDVLPIASVERWRDLDGGVGPDTYGPGDSLKLAPRVWLYWTRQHDDTLGPRVYYRTWRMVNFGDATNPKIVRLEPETRSSATLINVDMPERMLPMEVLSPDGTATVARMSASANSPEAGLWVLTTQSRDLWPLYPNAGEGDMTRHDLFMQVINVPVPDR